MSESIHTRLRKWRENIGLNLEEACALYQERGFAKPSTAKLSRIERDQFVPVKMVPAVQAITGIPAKEIRPDLAELLGDPLEAAQ